MKSTKLIVPEHKPECPLRSLDGSEFKSDVDFSDIQGDIIAPFPKKFEQFIFFHISDASQFKKESLPKLLPKISSAADVVNKRKEIHNHKEQQKEGLVPVEFVNVSFSNSGLEALLGEEEASKLGDSLFKSGQLADAEQLGDRVDEQTLLPKDWIDEFKGANNKKRIDGLLLVVSDSSQHLEECCGWVNNILKPYAEVVYILEGRVRDPPNKDHEYFGWMDGISNPFVDGVYPECYKVPGQRTIKPGIVLVGHEGDVVPGLKPVKRQDRPDWAHNGSFLAYRQLDQLVPEFHNFVRNSIQQESPGLPKSEIQRRADLRAAQFVGRWPSGTPLELRPDADDRSVAENPGLVNNFEFQLEDQTKCPFSAHIRKMNPRLSKDLGNDDHSVVRAGITYGEEVKQDEETKTKYPRGLAFVGYQSQVAQGFAFQQKAWANNPDFPQPFRHADGPFVKGLDPLIGQIKGRASLLESGDPTPSDQGQARSTTDTHGRVIQLHDFIIPRGGGYFFVPPMKTLQSWANGAL